MAKKKGGKFTFSEIGDLMNDMSKKMPIVINDQEEYELIGTGIYILNAMLSGSLYGGIQSNRISCLAGDTGVGKSFLAYGICREAQKKDWNIIYIDTEFSIQREQLPAYGIDISEDRFMLVRSNVIEDLKIMLTRILDAMKDKKRDGNEIPKTMIVLDSVGMLASRKEVEDAKSGSEKADMTRAKSLNSLFRIINSDLGYLNVPMVTTNHTYQCVSGDTNIIMANNDIKEIKFIVEGDLVKTLNGPKKVNFNKKMENAPLFKITLENGQEIKCTSEHKFLVLEDWSENEEDSCWKSAIDLMDNDTIIKIV